MKLKNTSKNIICIPGENILPGKTSEHDVESTHVIDRLVELGQAELVSDKKPKAEELPDDPNAALLKSIKAMRSLDKLKDKAAELGVEIAEDDTVDTIKEKLVAFCETQ